MPRKVAEMSPLAVRRLTKPGHYVVGGVAGLALQISDTGARSWVLRARIGSRRRDMGLGGYPDVDLALARQKAREARDLIDKGVDPILVRREAKSALLAKQASHKTFEQCATEFIDAKSAEWRNTKHAAQWTSTLKTYAYPHIGKLLVSDVGVTQVLAVLKPIWTVKTETATRVRGRIEQILDWATVQHYRQGPNPARWRGHLDKLLPTPGKVAQVKHHKALALDEVPAFYAALKLQTGIGARALELAVLTAARSGEVRGATWPEIDLGQKLWTVPAGRMKAGKEHRVPLSDAAVALLTDLPRVEGTELVFPSANKKLLSDMTLLAVMRRMKVDGVPHGFRSSFKDWATERTQYSREAVEMSLAHTIGDKVEAAYRRGDLLEQRRRLLADWAAYLGNSGAISR